MFYCVLDISTVGIVLIVSVSKTLALEKCRGELSEDVSFGIATIGTLVLVDRSIELGKPPQRGVIYT